MQGCRGEGVIEAYDLGMGARARDTLYFDGACGLCVRSTRVLRALDWFGRLEFQDQNALSDEALPVARDAALRGIPMRTRDGRTLVGYPAMRRALLQTVLGCVPALVMYVPGVSHVGQRVYARVAASRARGVSCGVGTPRPPSAADPRRSG